MNTYRHEVLSRCTLHASEQYITDCTDFSRCTATFEALAVAAPRSTSSQHGRDSDDSAKDTRLWKLAAYQIEVQAIGEKMPVMGENPTGYVNFSSDGRVFFILMQVLTPWRIMPNWADKGMTRSIITFEREE